MADDDGADAAEAAGRERAQLGEARGGGRLRVGLELVFGLGDVGDLGRDGRRELLVDFGVDLGGIGSPHRVG